MDSLATAFMGPALRNYIQQSQFANGVRVRCQRLLVISSQLTRRALVTRVRFVMPPGDDLTTFPIFVSPPGDQFRSSRDGHS